MTLYEISEDLLALESLLAELGGDVSDADVEAAFDAWFAEIGAATEAKVDGYCALIQEFTARAQMRAQEAARLQALAKSDTNAVERLKARLKYFLETTGKPKLETPRFRVRVQANGGGLPLIVNPTWQADPASAPEQFHKIKVELDTQAIREALHNDEAVEGCSIGERGTHLRIR